MKYKINHSINDVLYVDKENNEVADANSIIHIEAIKSENDNILDCVLDIVSKLLKLTNSQFVVYKYLTITNESILIPKAIELISKKTGFSNKTINYAINELIYKGVLSKHIQDFGEYISVAEQYDISDEIYNKTKIIINLNKEDYVEAFEPAVELWNSAPD